MNIPINVDFESYKDNFWKGFSVHETKYIAVGLAFGAALGFFLYFRMHLPLLICVYPSTLAVAPIAWMGMYRTENGLTMATRKKAKQYRMKTAHLCYRAREYRPEDRINDCTSDSPVPETAKVQKRMLKALKKNYRKYRKRRQT